MVWLLAQLIALSAPLGAETQFCATFGALVAQWKEERILSKEVSFPPETKGLFVFGRLNRPGDNILDLFEYVFRLEREEETSWLYRSAELKRELQANALEDFRSAKRKLASHGTANVPEPGSERFRAAVDALSVSLRSGKGDPARSSGQLAPVCLQTLLEADESELADMQAGSFLRFGPSAKGLERKFSEAVLRQVESYLALVRSADLDSGLPPEEYIDPSSVGIRVSRDNDRWTVIARLFDQKNRVKDTFGLQLELNSSPRYSLDDETMRRIRLAQVRWPASVTALSLASAPGAANSSGEEISAISSATVRVFAKSPWAVLAVPIRDTLMDVGVKEALIVCDERWIMPILRTAALRKAGLLEVLSAASEVAPMEVLSFEGVLVITPRHLHASELSPWNAEPAVRYVDSCATTRRETIDDYIALSVAARSPDLYGLCQAIRRLAQGAKTKLLSDTPPFRLCQILLQRDYWTRLRAGEAVSILDAPEDARSARDLIEEWSPFSEAVGESPLPRPALMTSEGFFSLAAFSLANDSKEELSPVNDLGTGPLTSHFDPFEYGAFLRRILPPNLDDTTVLSHNAYRVSLSRLRLKCSFRSGQDVLVPFGTSITAAPAPQALSSLSKESIDAILRGYRGSPLVRAGGLSPGLRVTAFRETRGGCPPSLLGGFVGTP